MSTETSPARRSGQRRSRSAAFTEWIEGVCQDPGARRALRSGLRRDLDHVQPMHRIVAPWLPQDRYVTETEERAYYTIASLIADSPRYTFTEDNEAGEPTPETSHATATEPDAEAPAAEPITRSHRRRVSLGKSFAHAVTQGPNRERGMRASTTETRLNLLTRQSTAGLHRHLPASVRYVRQSGADIDWAQLLDDLIGWPEHHGHIARRWLQDYHQQLNADAEREARKADEREALAEPSED